MFQLITDTACDLSFDYLKKNNVAYIGMTVSMNNQEYRTDVEGEIDYDWFIKNLESGVLPQTSQINVGRFEKLFRPYVTENIPILYLAFSSGLSGTYQSAVQAAQLLLEEFPDADIRVLDTKMAAGGQGLIVHEAIKIRDEGASIDTLEIKIKKILPKVQAWVTVNDLHHLVHGGRISKAQAIIGTLVSVKPIIYVDPQGKLQNVSKVRGRNKSLKFIADKVAEIIQVPEEATVVICHSGDLEAAKMVKEQILSQKLVKEFILLPLGPTIATHTGAGCIAVFGIGNEDRE